MSEFHCRIYVDGGDEAQSTHLQVDADQVRLTDGAYADYHMPFDKVSLSLVGSGPICVQLKVEGQDLTVVLTDLDVLSEFEIKAPGTSIAQQASALKHSLVKQDKHNRKKWMTVAAVCIGLPLIALIAFDSGLNLFIAQFDPKYEARIGEWIAASEQERRDRALEERVNRIGDRLVAKVDKVPYKFHFFVEKKDEVNACAYPGGVIVVNSALLDAADDDQVAGVLGHEIGHVLHRDTLRETLHDLGTGFSFAVFMHLIGLGSDTGDLKGQHLADLMTKLEALGYSRAQEASADREGVRIALRAGYKGDGLISFFEKQKETKSEKGGISEKFSGLFSTHPLDDERIEAIKVEIESYKKETSAKKTIKPAEPEKKKKEKKRD